MSISDLLDYCARVGFDGVDLTGYYFQGYKGYLPLETLGDGDPVSKVESLYKKVSDMLND